MIFKNLTMKQQFYLIAFVILFFMIFTIFSYNIFSSYNDKKNAFVKEGLLQAKLIANNSITSMRFSDKDSTKIDLLLLKEFPDILQVVIYDTNNKVFVKYNPHNRKIPKTKDSLGYLFSDISSEDSILNLDLLTVKQEIQLNKINYGVLYLEKSTKALNSFLVDSFKQITVFSLTLLLLVIFIVYRVSNKFINPIIDLSSTLVELSESKKYSTRLQAPQNNENNEIGQLYKSFNYLFSSMETYEEHLTNMTNKLEIRVQERTKELQYSLDTLKNAQRQLVESEKMASLGSLVSGVAHEINTPLGNAILGISHIKSETLLLHDMMQNNTLKKSVLEEKIDILVQSSHQSLSSLRSAADLVRSFKQISIDQSIEERRVFNLYEYVDEVVLTFHNKLKQKPIEVNIEADDNLKINSYPGAFAQILHNFIQNSIVHGFENKKEDASISIKFYIENDSLCFIYADNGCGIDESIKDTAFEPFITTKRNEGGTGLGLNIVYNIVTQRLNGRIVTHSSVNTGVKFSLTIPLEKGNKG